MERLRHSRTNIKFRMILRLGLLVFVGFVWGVSGAQDAHVFILPPSIGPKLLAQCSRPTPQSVSSFWSPTLQDVAELETLLAPFMRSTPSGAAALPLERFHRQYVGFIRDGKRYIYGNFYAGGFGLQDEQRQPMVICDGGNYFWGIVFTVESKSFEDLHFNGFA